jgi:transcription elongation factor GreA
MSDITYLTKEGEERLRAELTELKGPRREQLSKRLRTAIQQGDLSENADYIQAKEEQAFLEGRILELEQALKDVVIIEPNTGKTDVVIVGARVTVQEEGFPPDTYFLVGAKEAHPSKGMISNESPIGKALLDRKVGDLIEIVTPDGKINLKILKIE